MPKMVIHFLILLGLGCIMVAMKIWPVVVLDLGLAALFLADRIIEGINE